MQDVFLTEKGKKSQFFEGVPEKFRVFHYHDYVIELPDEVVSLAKSEITKSQAFEIGNTRAVQFHPELDTGTVDIILERFPEAFTKDDYVQTPNEIRGEYRNFDESRRILFKLFDNFVEKINGD